MADIRTRPAFGFPTADLKIYCRRFDSALWDESFGANVRRHLQPDFPQRFAASMARFAELETLRVGALGRAADLTAAKHSALEDVVLLAGSARAAARVVFADNAAMLHGEFFVGAGASKSIATILANAQKLVASCTTHAAALAEAGWSAEETALLAGAVEALGRADTDRETTTDIKEGYTAEQTGVANDLYRMCRAIQNVARVIYARKNVLDNPAVVAGRAKFMLGEFPPRPGARPAATEDLVPEAKPTLPVPTRGPAAESPTGATTPTELISRPHPVARAAESVVLTAPLHDSTPPSTPAAQNSVENSQTAVGPAGAMKPAAAAPPER